MITAFTTCKPFLGEDDWRQQNSLRSCLEFTPLVVLFGDDMGAKEVAENLGCTHVPDIESRDGRPYINAMFKRVQALGPGNHFLYFNSDNVMRGVDRAFELAAEKFPAFIFIGKRWGWLRAWPINDFDEFWPKHRKGRLHSEWGMEYFGFTRGLFTNLPPFLAGWPGWDNWSVLRALQVHVPVIDVTQIVTCLHQEHESVWRGQTEHPHYVWNTQLGADLLVPGARGSVDAATWVVVKDKKGWKIRPRQ